MTINETFIIGDDTSSGTSNTFSSNDNSVNITLSGVNVDLSVITTDTPISGDTTPITSGGVFNALNNLPNDYTTGVTLTNNTLFFDRTDTLSAYTVNLSSLTTTDNFTTAVTLSDNILYFDRTDELSAYTVNLSSLTTTDNYTTGVTLDNNVLYFDRTDELSAYTVNLSSLTTTDNYTTGVTLNNNILYFDRTDTLSAYTVDLSSLSAETPSLQQVIDVDQVADKVIFRQDLDWSASTNNVIYGSNTDGDSTILYGFFTLYNGTTANRLVRIDNLGNIDPTFNVGLGPVGGINIPNSIVPTNDGIYIGSNFDSFNGFSKSKIVRLDYNGNVDLTFNTGGIGFSNPVGAINIDSNGKLVVGGRLGTYNGIPVSPLAGQPLPTGLIRLNTDGTVDPTFSGVTGGTNNVGADSIIDQNGKIYLTSYATIINGQVSPGIMRFNQDGSTDTSFVVGTGFNAGSGILMQLAIDSLNRLYVYGLSVTYQGVTINRLVRLNNDGSIDTSFSGGTRFNGDVYALKIQSDDKLLVGGYFTSYDGTSSRYIIRLNTDGTIDPTFRSGFSGGTNGVETITILSNGKILVTGSGLSTYDGIPIGFIVILNEDGTYSMDRELTFQNGVAEYNITELSSTISSELLPKALIEDLIETYDHTSPLGTITIDDSIPTNVKFDISNSILLDIDGKEILSNKVNTLSGSSDNYPSITALNNIRIGSFGITIDGSNDSPTNGLKGYVTIPYNCIITGWDIIADGTGDCIIDVWKSTSIPNGGDTITGTEKPTLTSEQIHRNDALTTWDTIVNENDIIAFYLENSSNVNRITLIIKVIKN